MAEKKPEPSLDDLQFYADRLSNIISYIEQFKAGVDFLIHQRNDERDLNTEIPRLKKERDEAATELDAVKKEAQKAKDDHQAALVAIENEGRKATADLNKRINAKKDQLAAAEKAHAERMAEMDKEYSMQLADNEKKLAEQAERLRMIEDGINAHKEAMARL